MQCECRAPACRHLVGEFQSLPQARQAYYLAQEVVAPYIVRMLEGLEPLAAERAPIPLAGPRAGLAELNRRLQDFVKEFSRRSSAAAGG